MLAQYAVYTRIPRIHGVYRAYTRVQVLVMGSVGTESRDGEEEQEWERGKLRRIEIEAKNIIRKDTA